MTSSPWQKIRVNRIHPSIGPLIRLLQEHECYIAGGYARWACSPRENSPLPKDIDIICPTEQRYEALRASFEANHRKGLDTDFATTFRGPGHASGRDVQLLKLFRGDTIEACLDLIDFSVCRVAILGMDAAVADHRFLIDELHSRLTVVNLSNASMPENTIFRLMNYARKGYDFTQEDVMKAIAHVRSASTVDGKLVSQASSFSVFGS
ncbi:MAG: hypothetical protein AB7L09_03270 [Nitrospira sp.]